MNEIEDAEEFARLREWMAKEAPEDSAEEGSSAQGPQSMRVLAALLLVSFLAIASALVATCAHAAELNLACTPPTQYTDGTSIGSAPVTYAAYWGVASTALMNRSVLAGPGCTGKVTVPNPAPGTSTTYYVAVTAIVAGAESAQSNIASKTLATPLPTPKPPAGTKIVVAETAYKLDLGYVNQLKAAVAGVVPLGARCLPYEAMGLNLVDRQLLRTSAGAPVSPLPKQVLAKCSESS